MFALFPLGIALSYYCCLLLRLLFLLRVLLCFVVIVYYCICSFCSGYYFVLLTLFAVTFVSLTPAISLLCRCYLLLYFFLLLRVLSYLVVVICCFVCSYYSRCYLASLSSSAATFASLAPGIVLSRHCHLLLCLLFLLYV